MHAAGSVLPTDNPVPPWTASPTRLPKEDPRFGTRHLIVDMKEPSALYGPRFSHEDRKLEIYGRCCSCDAPAWAFIRGKDVESFVEKVDTIRRYGRPNELVMETTSGHYQTIGI